MISSLASKTLTLTKKWIVYGEKARDEEQQFQHAHVDCTEFFKIMS